MDIFYYISVGFLIGFAIALLISRPRKTIKLTDIKYNYPEPPKSNNKPKPNHKRKDLPKPPPVRTINAYKRPNTSTTFDL